MEILGFLMAVLAPLAMGVTKVLDSMAYRNRARGRAEIIRAEQESGAPQQGRTDV